MARVLRDDVYVGGRRFKRGQSADEVGNDAAAIGDHAWEEVESGAAEVASAPPAPFASEVESGSQFVSDGAPAVEPAESVEAPAEAFVDAPPSDAAAPDLVETNSTPEPPSSQTAVEPPPQSGRGASAEKWREYAASQGVEVAEDAKRDDVIDALRAAGKPVD